MRSWSLRPPYCRLGVPSWTVAKPRDCRWVPVAVGTAALERAWAEAFVGAAVRDNMMGVAIARVSGVECQLAEDSDDGLMRTSKDTIAQAKLLNRPMIRITKLTSGNECSQLSGSAKNDRKSDSALPSGVATN